MDDLERNINLAMNNPDVVNKQIFISNLVQNSKLRGRELVAYLERCYLALYPYIENSPRNKEVFIRNCIEKLTYASVSPNLEKKFIETLLVWHPPNAMSERLTELFPLRNRTRYLMKDKEYKPSKFVALHFLLEIANIIRMAKIDHINLKTYKNTLEILLRPEMDFSLEEKTRGIEQMFSMSYQQPIVDIAWSPPEQKLEKINKLINEYELYLLQNELSQVQEAIKHVKKIKTKKDGLRPLPLMALESFLEEDQKVKIFHARSKQ